MEYQNYELVEKIMTKMRGTFDEYLKVIEDMNSAIEENINNGHGSALDSIMGNKFKTTWENLYADFKSLEGFFSEEYSKVATTTRNNANYEESVRQMAGLIDEGAAAGKAGSAFDSRPVTKNTGPNQFTEVSLFE